MTKKINKPATKLVSGEILKEIQKCRPLRLFIDKQRKKGNENNPLIIRNKFLKLSSEKKRKYFQKSIDKYTELLDEKNISEHVQIEGQLFDILLSKTEQRLYFQTIDAPSKPLHSAAAYYSESKKHENDSNAKPWKLLSMDEKKTYLQKFNEAKAEYSKQVKNFAENLSERLKCEYLAFLNPSSSINGDEDDTNNALPITQRRKSVQSIPESFKTINNENSPKLTRVQLDNLHKCQPSILYYEKKVPDDEKPTFENSTKRNAYIRSLFNQLNEKKRHKFILKSTKKWEEFLQLNPTIIEHQIPTLHLLLGRFDDIHYYFSSLGLPSRPPISANILFNNEKEQNHSQQQNWTDLPQMTKDEYIKRLSKLKNDYQKQFIEFIEQTLSSDYFRLEFFRNIKYAAKDYELFTKDLVKNNNENSLKNKGQTDINEFNRIKEQLLNTQLNREQKNLVERLGQVMEKYIEETTSTMKESSNSINSRNSLKRKSTDIITINGDISNDNIERSNDNKQKKKHKQNQNEEKSISIPSSSSNIKKRK